MQRSAATGLNILKLLIKSLPFSAAIPVYNAYVSCHLEYCSSVWSGAVAHFLDPLLKLQKWAIGILNNARISSPNATIFRDIGVLPLVKRWDYGILSWLFLVFQAQQSGGGGPLSNTLTFSVKTGLENAGPFPLPYQTQVFGKDSSVIVFLSFLHRCRLLLCSVFTIFLLKVFKKDVNFVLWALAFLLDRV